MVFWHYFVWQLFWLLFKKLGNFFTNHLVTLVAVNRVEYFGARLNSTLRVVLSENIRHELRWLAVTSLQKCLA
jgi:hypothetical protein